MMTTTLPPEETLQLELGSDFTLETDAIATHGFNMFGETGSGKTNALLRILEQVGKQYVPLVVFAVKRNLLGMAETLPHGVVMTETKVVTAEDVILRGCQVVIDASSWGSLDDAVLVFADLLHEMTMLAKSLSEQDRVPVMIVVDEAQQIMAQFAKDLAISREAATVLKRTWQIVAKQCREYGLITSIATQNISLIDKRCMTGHITILLRQTSSNDLKRYDEYLNYADKRKAHAWIRGFATGKAIIIIPEESKQRVVTFYACESALPSSTPRTCAALSKFRLMPKVEPSAQTTTPRQATRSVMRPRSAEEKIRAIIADNPALVTNARQLAIRAQCCINTARKWTRMLKAEYEPMLQVVAQ